MLLELTGPFLNQCYDFKELLEGCCLVNTFLDRLAKQSIWFPDRFKPDDYKGGGFESFCEALIRLSPTDNRIGICQYKPHLEKYEFGSDGIGVAVNGFPGLVQCKNRPANWLLSIDGDHIGNLLTDAFLRGVPKDRNNLLIMTAGAGLGLNAQKIIGDVVRVLNRECLRQMVDNNVIFWNEYYEAFRRCRTESRVVKPLELKPHQKEAVNAILVAFRRG